MPPSRPDGSVWRLDGFLFPPGKSPAEEVQHFRTIFQQYSYMPGGKKRKEVGSRFRFLANLRIIFEAVDNFGNFWGQPEFWNRVRASLNFPDTVTEKNLEDVVARYCGGRTVFKRQHRDDHTISIPAMDDAQAHIAELADEISKLSKVNASTRPYHTWDDLARRWKQRLNSVLGDMGLLASQVREGKEAPQLRIRGLAGGQAPSLASRITALPRDSALGHDDRQPRYEKRLSLASRITAPMEHRSHTARSEKESSTSPQDRDLSCRVTVSPADKTESEIPATRTGELIQDQRADTNVSEHPEGSKANSNDPLSNVARNERQQSTKAMKPEPSPVIQLSTTRTKNEVIDLCSSDDEETNTKSNSEHVVLDLCPASSRKLSTDPSGAAVPDKSLAASTTTVGSWLYNRPGSSAGKRTVPPDFDVQDAPSKRLALDTGGNDTGNDMNAYTHVGGEAPKDMSDSATPVDIASAERFPNVTDQPASKAPSAVMEVLNTQNDVEMDETAAINVPVEVTKRITFQSQNHKAISRLQERQEGSAELSSDFGKRLVQVEGIQPRIEKIEGRVRELSRLSESTNDIGSQIQKLRSDLNQITSQQKRANDLEGQLGSIREQVQDCTSQRRTERIEMQLKDLQRHLNSTSSEQERIGRMETQLSNLKEMIHRHTTDSTDNIEARFRSILEQIHHHSPEQQRFEDVESRLRQVERQLDQRASDQQHISDIEVQYQALGSRLRQRGAKEEWKDDMATRFHSMEQQWPEMQAQLRHLQNQMRQSGTASCAPTPPIMKPEPAEIALPSNSKHLEYLKVRDLKPFLDGMGDEIRKLRQLALKKLKQQDNDDDGIMKQTYIERVMSHLDKAMEAAKKGQLAL